MLRLGMRSPGLASTRGGLADGSLLPSFLCPKLLNVDIIRIREHQRPIYRRITNIASTSKSQLDAIPIATSMLSRGDAESQRRAAEYAALVSTGMSPQSEKGKSKMRESKAEDDLVIANEIIDDILIREKKFSSKSESIFMLDEAKSLLLSQLTRDHKEIQSMIGSIAPKLVFAYVNLDQFAVAIEITQRVVERWTAQDEERHSKDNLWRAIITLAYTKGMYQEAAQLSSLFCLHSSLSGNWMSLARLQSSLRMLEADQHTMNPNISNIDCIWQTYEESGKSVPEVALFILLDSQIRRVNIEKVKVTLNAMNERKIRLSSDIWRMLLWYDIKGKRKREIRETVIKFLPDATLLAEELIDHFASQSNLRDCLRVLQMFDIHGRHSVTSSAVRPTFKMYKCMADLSLKLDQPQYAVRFLTSAKETGCQGDYTELLVKIMSYLSTKSRAEEALHLGTNLINSSLQYTLSPPVDMVPLTNIPADIQPSAQIYSALLFSVSRLSDIDSIVPNTHAILLEMFSHDIEVDDHVREALTGIVTRLGRNADTQALIRYLRSLFSRFSFVRKKAADWDKFIKVMHQKGVAEQLTLEAWDRNRTLPEKYNSESKPWSESEASTDIPFLSSSISAVDMHNREGSILDRVAFNDIDTEVKTSPAAFAMQIRIFSVIRRDLDKALAIYQRMTASGIQATLHHVAPIVEGLVLTGRLAEAHMIKDRAQKEFPQSDIPLHLYSALVRGYGQRGDWEGMLSLALDMSRDKIKITRYMHTFFKSAKRILRRRAQEASEEYNEEVKEKLTTLIKQPLPFKISREKPMSVLEATFTFNEYHWNGQKMMAQEHLSRALDEGLQPDGHLRDTLSRCDNWLRKMLLPMEGQESKTRQRLHLEECLRMCRVNRARMKVSKEEEEVNVQIRMKGAKRRRAFVKLLKYALASKGLWKVAHSIEYQQKQQQQQQQKRSNNNNNNNV